MLLASSIYCEFVVNEFFYADAGDVAHVKESWGFSRLHSPREDGPVKPHDFIWTKWLEVQAASAGEPA